MVYSCDTHLVLVGETTATCSYPSLQWLPPSDDVLCVLPSGIFISELFKTSTSCHNAGTSSTTVSLGIIATLTPPNPPTSSSSSLSTVEAVVATAVVCVVCSFTAGLLVGVLLTQCVGVCGRRRKRGQTEIPPVYEDITLEKTPAIQLQTNEAYRPISR